MIDRSPEQLDELISRMKQHADISVFKQDPNDASTVNMVSALNSIPKAEIPKPNLLRVRNKILDRISLPNEEKSPLFGLSFLSSIPRYIRVTGALVGTFMIMLSMTMATVVVALESVPGQTIYPVKKMAESVQLRLATSEEQKTNLQIRFANERVDELETLIQKQKEGKVSGAQIQKVAASASNDIKKTSENVTSKTNPTALNRIVTLSNKQAAVIQAAQVSSEGEIKIELDKALETTKTARQLAIENIEKAGLVVDDEPLTIVEEKPVVNSVVAEGKLTSVSLTSISVGTATFLLTNDTEYVNIKPVDIKAGVIVKITGEIKEKKTYAIKITAIITEIQTLPEEAGDAASEAPANTDQE